MSRVEEPPTEIRVLVADDSAVMRTGLSRILESSPIIRVCGTAKNGLETIEKIKLLRPDVVTLDVNMPMLDGIEALKQIMGECPCPVIMVSCLTQQGAEVTVEALAAGAFDYVSKDDLQNEASLGDLRNSLLEKVEEAAYSGLSQKAHASRAYERSPIAIVPEKFQVVPKVAVIGTSTGGPKALQEVIPQLPADLPIPLLVVQHMPPGFTGPLAKRLDGLSSVSVCEASHGQQIRPGIVYVAPAGQHTTLFGAGCTVWISLSNSPNDTTHKPSVDVTMCSVAEVFGRGVMGIILTGMGSDGVKGMTAIRKSGGITVGQDEASCAVYGMPRRCAETGVLQRVVPLGDVSQVILEALRYRSQE